MKREPPILDVGQLVGDRFTLARTIGTGAMGTVFEAEDRRSGARVALKALFSQRARSDAAERRARFLREAEVSAGLRHRHVVAVIDHGIDAASDTPYLVMPLLVGEDLGAVLARTGALDPRVAVPLILQACAGLSSAHHAGVVHRDVKPSNLFLETGDDGAIDLMVADFGLAKVEDRFQLTATGAFLGTPQYVSPEQATNAKRVDVRSDVWSVAMTLYHALAGAPAFARTGSFMALVLELTGSGVPPLQDAAPWVPAPLARVVHGALLRDPAARCPSIDELSLGLRMAVGFDVADSRPTKAALAPAPADLRAQIAERAELPETWDDLLRA